MITVESVAKDSGVKAFKMNQEDSGGPWCFQDGGLLVQGYWSETAAYNAWFRDEFGGHAQWIKNLMENQK